MNDFNKGDKVVCILGNFMPNECYNSKVNKHQTYTIASTSGSYIVRLQGIEGAFSTSRFELIGRV